MVLNGVLENSKASHLRRGLSKPISPLRPHYPARVAAGDPLGDGFVSRKSSFNAAWRDAISTENVRKEICQGYRLSCLETPLWEVATDNT